jgi:hypothetical protein
LENNNRQWKEENQMITGTIPANGSAPQQLSLGPNDKFVLILVDPVQQAIQTMAPNITDPLEVAGILNAALGSVIQNLAQKPEAKPRIIPVPPGSRIR